MVIEEYSIEFSFWGRKQKIRWIKIKIFWVLKIRRLSEGKTMPWIQMVQVLLPFLGKRHYYDYDYNFVFKSMSFVFLQSTILTWRGVQEGGGVVVGGVVVGVVVLAGGGGALRPTHPRPAPCPAPGARVGVV